MKRHYFGTDGVRGPYGGPVINEEFATRLGVAAVAWLRGVGERRSFARDGRETSGVGRILIGRDTRGSGASLEAAIARGIRAAGGEPISLGVVPTPAVARTAKESGARMGVVITASHNPASDNGIKFFGPNGVKLTDEDEAIIESHLAAPATSGEGQLVSLDQAAIDYVAAVGLILQPNALAGWKIVLDTANGATWMTSPAALRGLGAEVLVIGDAPDGTNINAGVGSEHPEVMAAKVIASGARLGIAHDGDGDRCVLCDEFGQVLDGDEMLTILATHAVKRGRLPKKTLVVTVQSNLGVDAAMTALGGRVLRTDVGDRYVIERMLKEGATLGGESSGHIICADVSLTGDGLAAALQVLKVMIETEQPLSELRQVLKKFPQETGALKVSAKKELVSCSALAQCIAELEAEMKETGRVLVRFSGTEAKLRLLVEAASEEIARNGLVRLEAAARADLDVL